MNTEVHEDGSAGWLEVIDGEAPILLIAPHGGIAVGKGDSLSIPKVNDLHTAVLTRELSSRLNASALINTAMDRNLIDCNRIGQLVASVPWLLGLLADRIEEIIATHGSVVVVSIHGWNLIEPRVDIGIGLRDRHGALTPARGAMVSVSEQFLNHTLLPLAARLRSDGIAATFGMRYPAADANNLIQALTPRNSNSEIPSLRRLAESADCGRIEAVQLELSIALRFPGARRERILDTLGDALVPRRNPARAASPSVAMVAQTVPLSPTSSVHVHPGRLGFEVHDPARQIGILASFDVGGPTTSARVMIMMRGGAIAMYTNEGRLERMDDGLRIGALDLRSEAGAIHVGLRAAMLITPDSASYCDIERALSRSALDEAVELEATIKLAEPFDISAALERIGRDGPAILAPVFGSASGRLVIGGAEHRLEAVGRIGAGLTSLDGAGFLWRRSIWAVFNDDGRTRGIELREQGTPDDRRTTRLFADDAIQPCPVVHFVMTEATPTRPPAIIGATFDDGDGRRIRLDGSVTEFVPLVRPGPNGARIFTALGLVSFTIDDKPGAGAGMFEQSRLLPENFRAGSKRDGSRDNTEPSE